MNYKTRRQKLLKEIEINSIVVLSGEIEKIRNNDVSFDFRQNSSYYYISGCNEPDTKVIIAKLKGQTKHVFFKKEQTELEKVWDNHKRTFKEEKELGGWDEVLDLDDYENYLKDIVKISKRAYIELTDYQTLETMDKIKESAIETYSDVMAIIERQRAIKSSEEVKNIKKAISITDQAINKMLSEIETKKKESCINADAEYIFAKNEVQKAYQTIVAYGNNGNILHYTQNNNPITDNKFVLVDVGCEYNLYASDISRTFPSKGIFTEDQKELYQALLNVQKKIISKVQPGTTFKKLNKLYIDQMVDLMLKLKIIKGEKKEIIKEKTYKKFCPHSIGHWLGLDVHDRNPYEDENKQPIKFEAGMVLTIEPGIYINENEKSVPRKYRGMAIRIEDDILITQNGNENLSISIPKEIQDLESAAKVKS